MCPRCFENRSLTGPFHHKWHVKTQEFCAISVFKSSLARLSMWEDSSKCTHCESFKSYTTFILETLLCTSNQEQTPRLLVRKWTITTERLCGLVVRVPGYRSRSSRFDSQRYQISWQLVVLEQSPLSLMRITEELPEWKSNGSSLENWD
jgi:hypothetical protein